MRIVALALAALLPLHAGTYYVTVAGLGGEPEYETRFTGLAADIDKLLKSSSGATRVETLTGPNATKARFTEVLNNMAKSMTAQDGLVVMLIGHGTFDNIDYKFNVPGPDISAGDLSALLDRMPGQQMVSIMTSASGGAVPLLKKDGRAVITATKSGTEKNAVAFSRYWAEALRDPAADADKNEVVSALEAYRYAADKTARFYETSKHIATEHAQIIDTSKGEPVRDPSPANGQGLLASRFALLRLGAVQKAAGTPEKQALLQKKEGIEQEIAKLKYQKAAMNPDEYRRKLADLLLQLSRTQTELEK